MLPCFLDCLRWRVHVCVWLCADAPKPCVYCCVYSVKPCLSMNSSILIAGSSGIFLSWYSPITSESALFCSSHRLWCWKTLKNLLHAWKRRLRISLNMFVRQCFHFFIVEPHWAWSQRDAGIQDKMSRLTLATRTRKWNKGYKCFIIHYQNIQLTQNKKIRIWNVFILYNIELTVSLTCYIFTYRTSILWQKQFKVILRAHSSWIAQ